MLIRIFDVHSHGNAAGKPRYRDFFPLGPVNQIGGRGFAGDCGTGGDQDFPYGPAVDSAHQFMNLYFPWTDTVDR